MSAGRLEIASLTRGKLRACVQLGTRWQPLSTPPTLWAWVGVGMGWGAGAMFGYDTGSAQVSRLEKSDRAYVRLGGGRERARRAHAQSCSSRATACPSLEYLLWTDPPSPGCAASLASRRPALGHTSATLQPHTAPAQQPAVPCTFVPLLPPTSRSLSHSLPALCARCGGDPPDLWSPLGSFPAAALLPIV